MQVGDHYFKLVYGLPLIIRSYPFLLLFPGGPFNAYSKSIALISASNSSYYIPPSLLTSTYLIISYAIFKSKLSLNENISSSSSADIVWSPFLSSISNAAFSFSLLCSSSLWRVTSANSLNYI